MYFFTSATIEALNQKEWQYWSFKVDIFEKNPNTFYFKLGRLLDQTYFNDNTCNKINNNKNKSWEREKSVCFFSEPDKITKL